MDNVLSKVAKCKEALDSLRLNGDSKLFCGAIMNGGVDCQVNADILKAAYERCETEVERIMSELVIANEKLKEEYARRENLLKILTRQTKEMERSNAELEQFACSVAHDLQQPLRTVVNYVQMLEKRHLHELDSQSLQCIGHVL